MSTDWPQVEKRIEAAAAENRGPAWNPPVTAGLASGIEVMAVDQSLSSSGWVHMSVNGRIALPLLHGKGTVRGTSEREGFLSSYDKAMKVHDGLSAEYAPRRWDAGIAGVPFRLAWESPAVHGHRTESSFLAGYLLFDMCNGDGTMVNANHVSKLLTGNPHHDKKEIAGAVTRFFPDANERTWNQHERDAAAIGLAFLLDLKAEQDKINSKS